MIDSIITSLAHSLDEVIEIILFGFAFFFIERINPADKTAKFFKDDMNNEIFLAAINAFLFIPLCLIVSSLFVAITLQPLIPYQMFAPQIQSLPIAVQILIGSIIVDFSTYWRHRFTHFHMWSYHSVHHSAKQLTWISGLRLHPIDLLAALMLTSSILYIVGFSGVGFLGTIIFIKLMNYTTHMNYNLKFGKPLRYILASPHYHRWHHATEKSAYDKNFCGAFPFLDIIFGTYYHPEELPQGYGLSPQEQKNFPEHSNIGWLTYPFKRTYKIWKKKLGHAKKNRK
ncbi:MAG: sterol desaturase family protein [Alphaproteobacteria bacterium]